MSTQTQRSRLGSFDFFGGWHVDSGAGAARLRRVAPADRRTSLLIVLAAALTAMASVVFDLRLPTASTQLSAPITIDLTEAAPTETVAAPPSAVQPPEPRAIPADAATTTAPAASQRADTEVTSASATDSTASDLSAGAAATTTEAALSDPASRIRQYLGLGAGEQLPVSFVYTIEPGDNATSIATRFGLVEDTVLFNNFDIYDPNHLTVGQEIVLPPVDGLVYTVQSGDAFSSLMENYQADESLTLAWPANGISSTDQIYVGQRLLLVQGSASVASGASFAASNATWTVPSFRWPLGFDRISDPFGTPRANAAGMHTGVDFVADVGTIVGSTWSGIVSVATWGPSYGNWVEIDHGGGYRSRYAHLDEIWVWEGQWVDANDFIGSVGNTGNSSGAHLHFEIIINGQAVDPLVHLE